MELLKDLYILKSGVAVAKELDHCFNCAYCRANNGEHLDYSKLLPSEINPLFTKLPVMVNIFYGDPFIQTDGTIDILRRLAEAKHTGPVIIVTKADMSRLSNNQKEALLELNKSLDLHFGLSTFGMNSEYDGGSLEKLMSNLEFCRDNRLKSSIEFRPIIYKVNDFTNVFERVLTYAHYFKVPVGYCGLQVSDQTATRMKEEGICFAPYPHTQFGLKKQISAAKDNEFRNLAKDKGVLVYKKSSCIFSMQNSMRDYNAHYYRPKEVGCADCPNQMICHYNKGKNDVVTESKIEELRSLIPFDFELVYKDKHVCSLFQSGLCKFPTNDCKNLSGAFIKIDEEITTSDVRVIKWLTGYTVDAKFVELPFISPKWKKLQ